jgi:hypothetical protein
MGGIGGAGGAFACTGTSCGSGKVCVTYTQVGSAVSACKDNPCTGQPLSCDCAGTALCTAQGFGLCNVATDGTVDCLNGG